ncbi:membrane protein [Kiloniella litopenaei]|uniref:Membrane protein n=1 Tax=Kiloniella litopenaei TaxID=1549748 RepID=A0A0M2R6U5_9PROT|nr:DMT family transporter [Kiloniella litopenaei]KKJ76149.1 membrane protein [Kiloniella litopenaei]
MNILLYIGTVLIWGTTWLAIAFQVGTVQVEVSAFYRFSLAALTQILFMLAIGKLTWVPIRQHKWFVLQGWFLFCLNFIFFYNAAKYLPSGLIAVVFSLASIFNMINASVFQQKTPTPRPLIGACLGVLGVCALFWEDIQLGNWANTGLLGLLLSLAGTYCFSLGNLVSQHQQKAGRHVLVSNSYALVYGSITLGLWCLLQGFSFDVENSYKYLGSLFYLAIPGTVIGFAMYLKLIGKIGAEKAAYSTVLFPIVALSLSTLFEGYIWTETSVLGVLLALGGNLIVFSKWSPGTKRQQQI